MGYKYDILVVNVVARLAAIILLGCSVLNAAATTIEFVNHEYLAGIWGILLGLFLIAAVLFLIDKRSKLINELTEDDEHDREPQS